jgi:hypothetical protein
VAEEVVLAADLLVEDLAADSVVDLAAEASLEVAQWRLVTDSVNINKKKAANCSFFCDYSVSLLKKHFIMLYTGKFYYYPPVEFHF